MTRKHNTRHHVEAKAAELGFRLERATTQDQEHGEPAIRWRLTPTQPNAYTTEVQRCETLNYAHDVLHILEWNGYWERTRAAEAWAPFKSIFDELEGCLPADVQGLYTAFKTADGETIDQALNDHLKAHGEPEQQALAELGDPLDAAGAHRKRKPAGDVDHTQHGGERQGELAVYLAEHLKWNRAP